jgi:DNA-binding transcriptional MerR regulator
MVNYLAARSNWLTEAKTSVAQLTNLVHDLKNGSVEDEEVIEFITEEKKEAEKIIDELKQNTEVIRNLLQQYNQALPTAEMVVKRLNNEVLPDIVKPAIRAQIETD